MTVLICAFAASATLVFKFTSIVTLQFLRLRVFFFPSPCILAVPVQAHHLKLLVSPDQIRSVPQSCLTLCDPMNCSTPGLPVQHQLPEFTETHVHRGSDAIQPSHPLSSPSPPAPNPSQHQSLFQGVNSSHEVAKVLEFQL